MMKLSNLFLHFQTMKFYFFVSAALFIAGIGFGYVSESFRTFLDSQLSALGEIAQELSESENPELTIFLFIFLNNAVKCVLIVFLGLMLGVIPLLFILLNGMVMGYLIFVLQTDQGTASTIEMLVKGILPHGIIEIPVLLLASAYGMKMGAAVLSELIRAVGRKSNRPNQLRSMLKLSLPLSGFIVISLLVAALIESFITPMVMGL